jgi:ubiquinone/menaquinone biosynthesis C-methylase UbiE
LLYRLEPDLYEHLVSAERLHPGILEWLPARVDRIVEIGAGTGRLTLELVSRCRSLTAIEPAAPLRDLLKQQLDRRLPAHAFSPGPAIQLINGFFDALPLPDRSAELVIACSALTADASHGGQRGLAEMERVCTPEGLVVIVWPNNVQWLQSRGYRYRSFPGRMAMHFASVAEAVELASVFYPKAAERVRRLGNRVVPYEWLGVNPPRDLAYKLIA